MTVPSSATKQVPIAVVGVSAIFPGTIEASGFWNDILQGVDRIIDVPESHWLIDDYYDPDPTVPDKTYGKRGAFLGEVDFDPLYWGVPPSIIPATDTVQLLALIAAKMVLDDATNGQFSQLDKEKVSVILGVTSGQELLGSMVSRLQKPIWIKALREMGLPESQVEEACERITSHYADWQESTFPGLLGNVVAGRIANRLDLGGTNCVTDAACASSFSALSMAVNELILRQSDMVIAGGCDTMNDIFMHMCFSKTPALSASGDCRPFSDQADGTLLGEGFGMVALKRLDDAEADGDHIYAVIRGVGSSSDGRSKSVYAPRPEGQMKALLRAYERAGYGPESIELVEAHGTGTKAGDAAEFEGLRLAFGSAERQDKQWCAMGTVKSQIGHTKAAAGAAGLLKAIFAVYHKVLPPTIKIDKPNPKLDIENTPFYLNTKARPWVRGSDHRRRAGVSSFGFGGSNYHLTIEEYEAAPTEKYRAAGAELLLFSAADAASLGRLVKEQAEKARAATEGYYVAQLARKSQLDWKGEEHRLAVVAHDAQELADKLEQAATRIAKGQDFSGPGGLHYASQAISGKVAFLFPGQGSQYLDMGAELAMTWEGARVAWDKAADTDFDGSQLHQVVFPLPVFDEQEQQQQQQRLTETQWAQPAIGVASLSLLNLLQELGVSADAYAGHSFGEVTALHAAGVFDQDTMLQIARKRGELMAEAAQKPGSMAAVTADAETLTKLLKDLSSDVVLANHNAPDQTVISGPTEQLEKAEQLLQSHGLTVKRLPVATAFHSSVVSDSTKPFAAFLASQKVKVPQKPVYANSTAVPYPKKVAAIRQQLANQVANPVRFVEQVQAMYASGVRHFIEVGPASVLTGLVQKILGRDKADYLAVALDHRRKDSRLAFLEGLGQLAVAGVQLDFTALWHEFREFSAAQQAAKMKVPISGANYGNPYPPKGGSAALPGPNPEPVETPQVHTSQVATTQAVPTAPVAPQPQATGQASWTTVYQHAYHHTTNAHHAFQQAMSNSHMAFMNSVQQAQSNLQQALVTPRSQPRIAPSATVAPSVAPRAAVSAPVQPTSKPATKVSTPAVQAALRDVPAPALQVQPVQAPVAAPLDRLEELEQQHKKTPVAPEIGRYTLALEVAPATGFAMPGLERKVAIYGCSTYAPLVTEKLVARGVRAFVAEQLTEIDDAVVFLGGLTDGDIDHALTVQKQAFRLAKHVAPKLQKDGGLFVTVQDTGGDFSLRGSERAWMGGLTGLVKTAAWEWPQAAVKAIDIAQDTRNAEQVAEAIAEELVAGGNELEVGLPASGGRFTLRSQRQEIDVQAATLQLNADDVIVASGGARGVTAHTLIALSAATQASFVLLGRSKMADEPASVANIEGEIELKKALFEAARQRGDKPKPAAVSKQVKRIMATREIKRTLAAMRKNGSKVRYVAVSVTDTEGLAREFDTVRKEWGGITGVVHGAGVLADKKIVDKTDESFDFVFDTKVQGLRALLEVTTNDPLKFWIQFSSVAGRCGNQGQVDYAMANEILNKVGSHLRKQCGIVVKSLGWGPWEGGMVTEGLKRHFAAMGVALIPMDRGATMLVDELLYSAPQAVEIVLGGELKLPHRERSTALMRIDGQTHPYLHDHQISGVPVVPMALVMEWFLRIAQGLRSDLYAATVQNLQVVHGISVPDMKQGLWLQVSGWEISNGSGAVLGVEIKSLANKLHYKAQVLMSEGRPRVHNTAQSIQLDEWQDTIYDGHVLFHGKDFHIIDEMQGISNEGIAAQLKTTQQLAWANESWATDPAALDGGLQLALLWSKKALGGATLPTAVKAFHRFAKEQPQAPIHCVAIGKRSTAYKAVTDMVFTDSAGDVIATFEGVETHLRPGEQSTAKKS